MLMENLHDLAINLVKKGGSIDSEAYAHPSHEMYNSGSVVVDHSLHLWSSNTLLSSWKLLDWTITVFLSGLPVNRRKGTFGTTDLRLSSLTVGHPLIYRAPILRKDLWISNDWLIDKSQSLVINLIQRGSCMTILDVVPPQHTEF